MHVKIERTVPGISPRDAAAWWSDFREGATDHAFFPTSRRLIVERGPDHVTMQERAMGFAWEVVTAWPGERAVRFVGRNRASTFRGEYRFEDTAGLDASAAVSGSSPAPLAAGGTRIVLEADITLAKGVAWSARLARPLVLALLEADLRGHAKEMQRDLSPRAA